MTHVNLLLHKLRVSWRKTLFDQWLNHKKRRDSAVARAAGCNLSAEAVDKLCSSPRKCITHEIMVACGGMLTITLDFDKLQRGESPLTQCPYCGSSAVPEIVHIFWECPKCVDIHLQTPACPLQKRLGWDVHGVVNQAVLKHQG